MTVSKKDPDRLAHKFWVTNRKYAPHSFKWEDGVIHYTYAPGRPICKVPVKLEQILAIIWSTPSKQDFDMTAYSAYMLDKMKEEDHKLVFEFLKDAPRCDQVYGDCTYENIIYNPTYDSYTFIDPGYPRGFVSPWNDKAKLLQSQRGWEQAKKGETPKPLVEFSHTGIAAAYMTHLYRLLRHKHSGWCLSWAKNEIKKVRDYLAS